MNLRIASRIATLTTSATLLFAPFAAGQTTAPRVWRLGAGYESSWLRDVARTAPPADASPVTREGHGATVDVQRDWASLRRLHRVRVNAGWARGIAYRTPTQSVIPQPGENGFHFDGGYEYRRYLYRDLWADGLDVGMGVEGLASVRRATFAFDPSIEARHRGTDLTASIVAAARLRRWQAWQLEVAWVNGISLGRSSVRHSAAAVPETREWGGGWLTDLVARVDLRMSPTLGLFVTALTSARGLYEAHASAMTGRTQFLAGVAYAR